MFICLFFNEMNKTNHTCVLIVASVCLSLLKSQFDSIIGPLPKFVLSDCKRERHTEATIKTQV